MNNVARKPMSPLLFRLCMTAMAVLICVSFLYIKGNPFTKNKIDKIADSYVQQTYPEIWKKCNRETDAYFINDILLFDPETEKYSLDDGKWYVYYSSEEDSFLRFNLCFSRKGELVYDGCKEYYLLGGTIYEKLSDEYRSYVLGIHQDIYNNGMPKSGISLASLLNGTNAEAHFVNVHHRGHDSEYTGPELDITKKYPMEELAAEYGHIDFNYEVEAEDRTMETLCELRTEMRDIIDNYNIPVKTVTVSFRLFDGAYNMPAEALYNDNLMETLEDYYINIYEQ